jgi:hypothetical protein
VINFDDCSDIINEMYKLELEGVECSIGAAAFRHAKALLHIVDRAMAMETESSEIPNEALRATRELGTTAVVADYAALKNLFLIRALMERAITMRGCGQAPVQRYWHELLKKIFRLASPRHTVIKPFQGWTYQAECCGGIGAALFAKEDFLLAYQTVSGLCEDGFFGPLLEPRDGSEAHSCSKQMVGRFASSSR